MGQTMSKDPVLNSKHQRTWYERNTAKKLALNEQYRKEHYERIKKLAAKRQDPFKNRARGKVNYALKTGKLKREPCWCGEEKSDFHHTNGYDEPNWFVGEWLCRKHHHQAHKELRWGKTLTDGEE